MKPLSVDLPAIAGGRKVRDVLLPYGHQTIDEDDVAAVVEILRSDYLTTGPSIACFEQTIADYVGTTYAVTFSSGTAALHGAVFAAGIGPGDEVITTPMTFAATANSILYMGGKPVFVDIQPDTYNINPSLIEQSLSSRTKAIMPVHYAGQPANLDEISRIAQRHRLTVIEDAAHALGATYKGIRVGSFGDMTAFSLHPVKPVTTGEGGVVTTNDRNLYERLSRFRSHGITRQIEQMTDYDGPWHYEMKDLGYNYRMTDLQASLGLSQMTKIDRLLARRREIAKHYTEAFANMHQFMVPAEQPNRESGWHLYVIRLNTGSLTVSRRKIFEALQAENIGVNVHYMPVYYHPYYRSLGYEPGLCPNVEAAYEEIITLPLFPKMTDEDVDDVIEAVRKVMNYYVVRG